MDPRERLNLREPALQAMVKGSQRSLWTALPGIVQAFDAARMTCTVQPAIRGSVERPDGSRQAVDLPLLLDVPTLFQAGGGVIATFPVAAGDECLVIFASRHIDAWWQSGGVQEPMSGRMHSLSDGFAIVGPRSVPRVPGGISTSAAQIRSLDGAQSVSLTPGVGVTLAAAGVSLAVTAAGVAITGGTVTHNGVNIGATHRHGGVQGGSATSGTPT